MKTLHLTEIIADDLAGLRLDQALARLFPNYSRAQMQTWIENGAVSINHKTITKCKERVFPGQTVELSTLLENHEEWQAEQLPLDIVYEDDFLLVINKPPGLVVHPGAGNPRSTLVNALLHHDPDLAMIPRAGLVHRLDKDTSGLLLVARRFDIHHFLVKEMQQRHIHRIYEAIVSGHPRPTGTIDLPIGRHPTQRIKMAILSQGGRPARTHYKVLEKFTAHSLLEIELETGRTHQIRVHLAHVNHPILGDPLYGRPRNYATLSEELAHDLQQFKRQALHAKKISFHHPHHQKILSFEANRPDDFEQILKKLRDCG